MASEASGILRWTSSIRDSMTNDPGRQFFEDQVQSQGFLFLEEYLDNIWAAAKQDSFVDLVKTPGRRRASPRKAQPAVTTHTTPAAFSDEEYFFQSNHFKPSPSPFEAVTKPGDHVIDVPSPISESPPEIVKKTEVAPQPLPSVPSASSTFIDMSVPLKEDASANLIARNSSLSQFPSLAAPSPLRKSGWNLRESSLETSLATTPGTGLTGNHTSWLAKVREAKAMEVTIKRASVAPAGLTAPSGGVKRKSDEIPGPHPGDDSEERRTKILKTGADVFEVFHPEPRPPVPPTLQLQATDVHTAGSADDVSSLHTASETDMMAPLKKAIEVLRARTGKSLAGNLVEMNAQEPSPVDGEPELPSVVAGVPTGSSPLRPSLSAPILIHGAATTETMTVRIPTPPRSTQQNVEPIIAPPPREEGKRLSVSDLVPKYNKSNATNRTSTNETRISTTPPDSPPATKRTAFFVPGGPVFNKPPPVFVPPPTTRLEPSPVESGGSVPKGYSLGAPFGLGLQPTKLSKSPPRNPLSGQSTQSSLFSDTVFDSQNNAPAWAPRSQETHMTSQESQHIVEEKDHPADLDDDDSWRIDDKFAATNQMWTPFAGITAVEDSMTWSTAPSESQIGSKSPRPDPTEGGVVAAEQIFQSQDIVDELDKDMAVDDDMKRDILDEGKLTVSLVTANRDMIKRQLSAASSSGESSQAVGFFGHATKLVSSMLGVSKKNKMEPPKSIQLAAAAAKKQQGEQNRKAARLKEMEARRQAVLQKKAEEEKVKAGEKEKKVKEDTERRKKEREENTGKRPLVRAESKLAEEDNTRKRKMTADVPKTKPPSKEKKDAPLTRITKPGAKAATITKQPSAMSLNQTATAKAVPLEKSITKTALVPASAKGKGKMPADHEGVQSKKAGQLQMAVHAHPQRSEAEPSIASETIELPEPNSEYSDSEDEGRQQKLDAPEWTQSPELRAALESQSRVNPDDIFGPVLPLRMEDIFRTRTSRFRARTSSANWSGPDGLRQEEEREYARRMGFR